jgi:hypothetical protein
MLGMLYANQYYNMRNLGITALMSMYSLRSGIELTPQYSQQANSFKVVVVANHALIMIAPLAMLQLY